ncbi:MAG: polysaccharide biosynthesis C-terminal domain-containing protein, partial [Spirochaetes bacterium]|nr:polysaccharide biosynthesis C-terminal domain-containing protein [Spirochaetota bacterium]
VGFFIFTIFFLFAEEIVTLVYGNKFIASASILWITAMAIPFMFDVSGTIITAMDLQKYRTRIQFFALVINVISGLILIYFYKAEGAAISVVITYVYFSVTYKVFLYRKKQMKIRKVVMIHVKLIMSVIGIILLHRYYLSVITPAVSAVIVSALYALCVLILLVRKDDIRIIKEIIHGKTKKIKNQVKEEYIEP